MRFSYFCSFRRVSLKTILNGPILHQSLESRDSLRFPEPWSCQRQRIRRADHVERQRKRKQQFKSTLKKTVAERDRSHGHLDRSHGVIEPRIKEETLHPR